MKKVLTMSMVAAITVAGNVFAAERDTRMSDIVRLLEDNPEMMAEVESDIATRAALKVPTTKVVSLKKTKLPTNGLYNTISGPSLGDSNGETSDGTTGRDDIVQNGNPLLGGLIASGRCDEKFTLAVGKALWEEYDKAIKARDFDKADDIYQNDLKRYSSYMAKHCKKTIDWSKIYG